MLNIKSTKKALVTGIISMSLCSAMLVGSTYAWFTDIATDNTSITAGKLDIEAKFGNEWDTATFEPGAVVYKSVELKNVGNVNAKCKFNINVSGDSAEGFKNALEIAIMGKAPAKDDDFSGVTFTPLADYNPENVDDVVLEKSADPESNPTTKYAYVVLRWKTTNGESDNDLKGQTLQIKVDAVAIQATGDEDGTTDNDYDIDANDNAQ